MRFQCPFCRGIVAVENSDLGIDVQCGHCSEVVTVPPSRVSTGAVISDFIILEELGRGGMGVVYLAYQISLDRPAALKVLSENYANNAEFVVGFIKEARAAAKLNHPHIVQAYAVGDDEGIFFFAMENVDGETMKAVLKQRKVIPVDEALTIIQQIAEALDYAWKEQRLIHRDIKPDNIMITKNGRAKLADLGLARIASDIEENEDEDEVMGTPQYISPEHLTGAPMDVRSDIYSLGATFFHLITGRFPFEGRSATEIARKHLEEPLRSPKELNDKLPDSVCKIIQKMMAKNVKERYQDAEELVEDLRSARRSIPSGTAGTTDKKTSGRDSQPSIEKKKLTTKKKTGKFTLTKTSTHVGGKTGVKLTKTKPKMELGEGDESFDELDADGAVLDPDELMEEQEGASKSKLPLIIAAVVIVLLIAGAGAFFLMQEGTPPAEEIPQGDKNKHRETTEAQAPVKTPRPVAVAATGGNAEKINAILSFAAENMGKDDQILEQCDEFLTSYEGPSDSNEKNSFQRLLMVYIPLDEKRIAEKRNNLKKEYLDKIATLKKEEQERLRREKEEKEKEKRAAARQAAEEELKRREEELKQKRRDDYLASIDRRMNLMRRSFIDYMCRQDFDGAKRFFQPALNEKENTPEEYHDKAKEFSEWAEKMIDCINVAEKMHKMLDSGEAINGVQLEAKNPKGRNTYGKITAYKDGKITIVPLSGKAFKVTFEELSTKQADRLIKKVATAINDEAGISFYYLSNADFNMAKKYALDDNWKNEFSKTAFEYFKRKIKFASPDKQKELAKQYGRLNEYKKAHKAIEKKEDSEDEE